MRQKHKTLQLQKNKKSKNFHDQKRKKNDKNKKTNNRHRVDVATIVKKIRSNRMRKNRIIQNLFVSFVIKKSRFLQIILTKKKLKIFVNTIKNDKTKKKFLKPFVSQKKRNSKTIRKWQKRNANDNFFERFAIFKNVFKCAHNK